MGLNLKEKLITSRGIKGELKITLRSKDSLFSVIDIKSYSRVDFGICKLLKFTHIRDRTIVRNFTREDNSCYRLKRGYWEALHGLGFRKVYYCKEFTFLGHESLCFRGVYKRINHNPESIIYKKEGFLAFKDWIVSVNRTFLDSSASYKFLEKGYGLKYTSYFNNFNLEDHILNFSRFYDTLKHTKSDYGVHYGIYNGLISPDGEMEECYNLLWKSLQRRKIEVLTAIEDREYLGNGQTINNSSNMEITEERLNRLKRNHLLFGKFYKKDFPLKVKK